MKVSRSTKWRVLTVLLLGFVISLIAVYDVYVLLEHGVETTISRVLYYAASDYPIIGVLFGLSVGVVLGHLFWPQMIDKDSLR